MTTPQMLAVATLVVMMALFICALVVSGAVARSGVIDSLLARLSTLITRIRWRLTALVSSVTLLSALVNNIGALAILMPAAIRMAREKNA